MGQWVTYMRRKRTEDISVQRLTEELRNAKYVVALTGAGVSAESGIPTFRDPSDGLWRRYDPAEYATIWGFWRNPSKIWQLLHEFLNEHEPEPNHAHVALARLEALGIVRSIITQNVDNLHQDAGSRRVIEFHGNLMNASCYRCGAKMQLTKQMARNPSFKKKLPPKCACGGYFKPDAILFGEGIPSQALREANLEADKCDLMLVVGTSATVHPASEIPYRAMRRGAKIIEINLEKTGLTNRISDMIYFGRASELMQTLEVLEAQHSSPGVDDTAFQLAAGAISETNLQSGLPRDEPHQNVE
ncbi:NAD-dependent protein deacylase Sir2A [Cyclospora cayetanensis]|uniref:NAD-dependent protein deacylase Sir2A n=1 Tax=Cyclospora cayetanensis TaxID=88456 RepID=A0A6P6S0B9_9EIME|nr:NAD-dependent protein deacylase Sir2A [Cyclospora cayetanensis]